MVNILPNLINLVLEAILVSGLLGYFFLKREERLKRTIEEEFKKRDAFFNAQYDYKRRTLEELLGPMIMQLKRSKIALDAYQSNDNYREAILKQCNETTRDLLLSKGFLIPPGLQSEAGDFLKHYDGWLLHYHQLREVEKDLDKPFVFTYDFPKEAEKRFTQKYYDFRDELKIDDDIQSVGT